MSAPEKKIYKISVPQDTYEIIPQRLYNGTYLATLPTLTTDSVLALQSDIPADTNYYHTAGSWSGLSYTLTGQGGASNITITLPTGTTANKIPVLDSNGKLPESVIPAVAITDTYVVASQDAMLALTAQKGDIAIRSDLNQSFVLQAAPASTLENWKLLLTPPDVVLSVNGKTGTVTLDAADVGALPDSTYLGRQIIVLEDNGSTTAGTWLAKTNAITALDAGQIFLYKVTVAGASTTKLNITCSGTAAGAKNIYRYSTTKLTTNYAVGEYILLYYDGTYFKQYESETALLKVLTLLAKDAY